MNMRELQKAQQRVMKMQEELEAKRFIGTSGGGAVTITMSGKFEVLEVKIDPEAFSADDINELEIMVRSAAKDAFDKATEAQQQLLSSAMGGMRMPGMF